MPNLQIRDLPEEVYRALSIDAQNEHRSLTQQAIVELREAQAARRQTRAREVLDSLRISDRHFAFERGATPEALIRQDRRR